MRAQGFDQGLGVGAADLGGLAAQGQGVARLFPGCGATRADEGQERIEGQKGEENLLPPDGAVVAAFQVRQFVGDDGARRGGVRAFGQGRRQDQHGPSQPRQQGL